MDASAPKAHDRASLTTLRTPQLRSTPLPVTLSLLALALLVSVAMMLGGVPVIAASSLPWMVLLTSAIVVVRVVWARFRGEGRFEIAFFFLNILLAALAIVFSPVFGVYVFISYYEAARMPTRAWRILGVTGTALVIALAQVGGPTSPLFTLWIYLAFVAINLGIALLMNGLEQQRERLMREVADTNEELVAEQARSALLLDQLVAQARAIGITEERERLSREIHDTVAQDLIAIIAHLEIARDAGAEKDRERWLAVAQGMAREALGEARRAVKALASPRLDDADLPLALDDLLGEWRETTGLDGELTVTGRAVAAGHDVDLLRVAQEALTNVAKHAGASRVDVELAYSGDSVHLSVTDDGVGFEPGAASSGFGLKGVRSRMERAGGSVSIESRPDAGTSVVARLLVKEAE